MSLVDECKKEAALINEREYHGRGIITASEGSKRFLQTLISLTILRKDCDLPIELFYADEDELNNQQLMMLKSFNVRCINIQTFNKFKNYDARNFSIKALAIYLSSFEEVIWMDADVIPLINFQDCFDIPIYKKYGQLFFEDIFSYDKNENAMTQKTKELFKSFDEKIEEGTPETDSGLFLLNKSQVTHEFITTNLLLNIHHKSIYKKTYGDKELYRLSMSICKKPYVTNDVFPRVIGKYFQQEKLMCGNGVVLYISPTVPIAIHMTLHSVDHYDKYNDFWKESFWTHWIPHSIEVDLQMVEPLNQEIIPKYRYDYRRIEGIPEYLIKIQNEIYKYINENTK